MRTNFEMTNSLTYFPSNITTLAQKQKYREKQARLYESIMAKIDGALAYKNRNVKTKK